MMPSIEPVPTPAVISGFAPEPDFWNTTGFDAVPVAVITRFDAVSVKPAATLKVTPPDPTPDELSAVIAAEIVA